MEKVTSRLIILIQLLILSICNVLIKPIYGGLSCLYDPCFEGSLCIDKEVNSSSHQCYCRNGFTGFSCEVNYNDCLINQCLNGGVCHDGIADFNCTCTENFAGTLCEIDLSLCNELCQNNSTCILNPDYDSLHPNSSINPLICQCPMGFAGTYCENDISMCNITHGLCLNGVCIDGFGDKWSCKCDPGWEGKICEINIDDCLLNPCQNDALCLDQINDFACACPFGYNGKACENKLNICMDNICQNSGFCLEENDGSKICYCIPDYHGVLCQDKYDECVGVICLNGGSCIDGVAQYHCSCVEPYIGKNCQCTIENSTLPECEIDTNTTIIEPSTSLGIPWWTITPTPTPELTISPISLVPIQSSTSFSINIEPSSYDPGDIQTSIFSISPSPIIPDDDISQFLPITPSQYSTPIEDFESATTTKVIIESSERMTPEFQSELASSLKTPVIDISSMDPTQEDETLFISMSKSSNELLSPTILSPTATVEIEESSQLYSSLPPESSIYQTEFSFPTISVPILQTPISSQDIAIMNSSSIISSISIDHQMPSSDFSISFPGPDFSTILASTSFAPSLDISLTPSPTLTSIIPEPTLIVITPIPPNITTPSPITPSPTISTSTAQIDVEICKNYCQNGGKCSISSSFKPKCVCLFRYKGGRCEIVKEKVENPAFSGNSYLTYKLPADNEFDEDYIGDKSELKDDHVILDTVTQMASASSDGTLLYASSSQALANDEKSKNIDNKNHNQIIRERKSNDKIYALVFLQNGLINFHFSCGSQSMNFVEKTRFDNGYNFTIELRLELKITKSITSTTADKNRKDGFLSAIKSNMNEAICLGQIKVNETFIMQGEQILHKRNFKEIINLRQLFVGGAPKQSEGLNELISVLPGFHGCLYGLQINKIHQEMWEKATDGREINECSTFGCSTSINPCYGGSRCISIQENPFWRCLCPDGYQGQRCQVRMCPENHCLNNGICTILNPSTTNDTANEIEKFNNSSSSTSNSNFSQYECLCKLGYSGRLCELNVKITKPYFKQNPHLDYSSYLSYNLNIPRFQDWMQLKLHFVTEKIDQIALMLYIGSFENDMTKYTIQEEQIENPNLIEKINLDSKSSNQFPDFFSISFIQGYIALTWDLGSGPQRLITPGRIDNRIQVHNLYAGRNGRQAWLKVDNMRNVTGKSPGPLSNLNTNSELFLGGYKSYQFHDLPHDLQLHKGFTGCIFDLGFRVKNRISIPKFLQGRNVNECYS